MPSEKALPMILKIYPMTFYKKTMLITIAVKYLSIRLGGEKKEFIKNSYYIFCKPYMNKNKHLFTDGILTRRILVTLHIDKSWYFSSVTETVIIKELDQL